MSYGGTKRDPMEFHKEGYVAKTQIQMQFHWSVEWALTNQRFLKMGHA